jgi:hypothetical protein
LNVDQLGLELGGPDLTVADRGDFRPEPFRHVARARGIRAFNNDIQIFQRILQVFPGFRSVTCRGRAQALDDIVLKRYLREVDVVGGNECGVVDIEGVIDDRVLLLAREQADRNVDYQQDDCTRADLTTKRALITARDTRGAGVRVRRPIGRHIDESHIDGSFAIFDRNHAVKLRRSHASREER